MSNWKEWYQARQTTAAQAVAHIKSGDRIAMGHACGSPEVLIESMIARADTLRDVEIVHMVAMGACNYCRPEYKESFRHVAIFAGGPTRDAIAEDRAEYVPCFFSEIPNLFHTTLPLDVAMIIVTPPDEHGYVSLGISVDYTLEALRTAKLVLAEVNPNMPRIGGGGYVHVSDIDWFVPVNAPMLALQPPRIGEVEMRIGEHVAALVRDGDCLQLGIGAIPDAVLRFLGDKKNLGIHSEMISDGVMHLVDQGVITGAAKQLHKDRIVITFAMGTPAFYAWMHNNVQVEAYPVTYVNDPRVIAQNDNVVSINSAISVDMLGQVAADTMGARQFSGVGGQVDFVRGAAWSRGGRSIIALPATAGGGKHSRISVSLATGQAVTTSRHDVDYVVTEYGVAALKGRTVRERAGALIAVAAPEFRADLFAQAKALYGWTPKLPEGRTA